MWLAIWHIQARRQIGKLEQALESASRGLEQLQHAFERFAPQQVVEEIIARGSSTKGERREVTVLFADLVGFTAMCEAPDPEQIVNVLNGYFQAMSRAVTTYSGRVSKFIGDGLMALFGAPEPNPWQTIDAVKAALAMREALVEYNKKLAEQGISPLALGIGIHKGSVVAGVIGSSELMEFTVIGDVVNTASRIESLTRKHGVDILVSAEVREALDDRFVVRAMPLEEVKGKTGKLVTYTVEGFHENVSR